MAFTDDAVKAKLSALNETQDGIVTVAQWIMFHRRHADRTAQLWMQRLKESTPNKKLNLIYLANEVVQQSKLRKKLEFLNAYSPIVAEATAAAYKGSSVDIQQKIRRVIEVWRQRQIFEPSVQSAIEKAVDELDRNRSTHRKAPLGGSLISSSSSVPASIQPLVPLSSALAKADIHAKPTLKSAEDEYNKLTDGKTPVPTPPVHAARLASLLKSLANAEGAVAESIKARRALISEVEKLLQNNKTALERDEAQQAELASQKLNIENRKREVEDTIMRGLTAAESSGTTGSAEPPRPDVEELTPPPMESFTPTGSPSRGLPHVPDDVFPEPVSHPIEPPPVPAPEGTSVRDFGPDTTLIGSGIPNPGADLLSSLQRPQNTFTNGHTFQTGDDQGNPKRRKMSRSAAEDETAAFADADLDELDDEVVI